MTNGSDSNGRLVVQPKQVKVEALKNNNNNNNNKNGGWSLLKDAFSMSIWIRGLRPKLFVWSCLAYLFYRLSGYSREESLLRDLIDFLTFAKHQILTRIINNNNNNNNNPLLNSIFPVLWKWGEDGIAILAIQSLIRTVYILYHYSWKEWKLLVITYIFDWAQNNLAVVQQQLRKQEDEVTEKGEVMLRKKPSRNILKQLPKQGRSHHDIIQELSSFAIEENRLCLQGKKSGTVYTPSPEHAELMNRVFGLYSWSNPLHPGIWPKLGQCEGEVIQMTAHMLHGCPPVGCITSGGTESILLAIRAHWNYFGKARSIRYPEIICAQTAHAAIDKACEIFGIRKVVVDCNSQFQINPQLVQQHITSNTILIYASAPCYPQGVVDPIEELSEIAERYHIGLHVDACLGGFVLPFVNDAPVFDFRNRGVTSMSADTHKYGNASKGTSVVLYRSKELRHGQYFCYPHWTGGMYATPTFAGSRPGALSACAWAAMVALGEEGYRKQARDIVHASRTIADTIQQKMGRDLFLLTTPQPFMVVCFGSHTLDIYSVLDAMLALGGWTLAALQSPPSIHLCVTACVVPKVPQFLQDLQTSVDQVRKQEEEEEEKQQQGLGNKKKKKKKGTAGIYGLVGSVPAGAVESTLKVYTDLTLAP